MPNTYDIVKHPLVTEKGTNLEKDRKYLFAVDKKANKHQVREAVQKIYKVTVTDVCIINVRPKKRKYKFSQEGYRAGYKKAVVTLKEGEKIASA
jgi:large subunit ribosomal protein L23